MFAVVWKYQDQVLIDIPEAFEANLNSEDATKEGRLVLASLPGTPISPIGVVQVSQKIREELDDLEDYEIPGSAVDGEDPEWQTFKDISTSDYWSDQPWWPSK